MVLLALLLPCTAAVASDAARPEVDFNREIRPLLSKNCFACHGPDESHREAGLRLDERGSATAKLESGETAIIAGEPAASELLRRITSEDESLRMPPAEAGNRLKPAEIELIRRWIEQGAAYAPHWSFVKQVRRPLPAVKNGAWPRNGIDHFVLSRLEREGLQPSPEADRYTLIRRLSLDLRGLPPTPKEVDAFVNDLRPEAYDQLVDRFLDDPAYGERWARMWLDLARYADSRGYGSDPLRENIWRYRDWVIEAFNRNLPYDRFTIEQLAGDLLPDATLDQRIATAFHRNTMTNTEGGTDDEEFRVAAVKDRVDTTMLVWMGLTMGCAKCHNHKYDPIAQLEYYRFYDYFNQTADRDLPSEEPVIPAPTPLILQEIAGIDAQIASLRKTLETPTEELAAAQAQWEASLQSSSEWVTLEPAEMTAKSGGALKRLEDGSILVGRPLTPTPLPEGEGLRAPERDVYTIAADTKLRGITAFRLEAIPDASLPNGGSGRGDDGNFVLTRFGVTAEDAAATAKSPGGRYVRVEVPGEQKLLSLAEVQVESGGKNVALAGTASQSSVAFDGPAKLAIDGNTNGHYFEAKSTTHTATEMNPWWEVDLGGQFPIDRITVWNRTDGGLQSRLANFRVSVFAAPPTEKQRTPVWTQDVAEFPNPSSTFSPSGTVTVALEKPLADFSQSGYEIDNVLKPDDPKKSGWGVAPKQKEPHSAWFLTGNPVGDKWETTRLTFTLEHNDKNQRHTLGRFRLSATSDPAARRRLPVPANILAVVDLPADRRSEPQRQQVAAHYRTVAPLLDPVRNEIARLEKSKPAIPTVPVMQELAAAQMRETHLMIKGNFLEKGPKVERGLPAAFHPPSADSPQNRLGVALWLLDAENPLTARVAVNRFWARLFGIGIVETEEDFGSQGELPTHPELLDWLAVEFRENGWNVKELLKLIVTSAAYRQSAHVSPELIERDPRNRLLSRGPRIRLEAEMVRDQALALAGLLSRKIYGPSVYPPQPDGLWRAAFNGQRTWPTSQGEDRYRRGLYTFWRRTVPYPSMATFDAPSREICAVRRIHTNTPLQAFVTLNDPVYVEASQALARRIVGDGGATDEERAAFVLRLCLVRPPAPQQVDEVLALYRSEWEHYRGDKEGAMKLASDPLGPLPDGMDVAELAAWTVVSNVILNLDAVLSR